MAAVEQALATGLKQLNAQLLPHQDEAVRFMLHREMFCVPRSGLLAHQMGLGKSIMAIACMLCNPTGFPCLIVAPSTLQLQWQSEIRRFTGLEATVLSAKEVNKQKVWPEGSDKEVAIISYALLARLHHNKNLQALMSNWRKRGLGRVVFDEAHSMKNPQSNSFEAGTHLARSSKHIWAMTGTPLISSLGDVMSLLDIIGVHPLGHPAVAIGEVRHILSKVMLRRDTSVFEDGQLPDLHTVLELVDFASEEEASLYAEVESHCFRRMREGLAYDNHTLVMEALTRCRQITFHPQLLIGALKKKASKGPLSQLLPSSWPFMSAKLDRVTSLVLEHQAAEKVLVFCTFLDEMHMIQGVLESHRVASSLYHGNISPSDRSKLVEEFQRADKSTLRVLIVQLQAGGTGLNLQAASRVIISSLPWSPAMESQGIHRALRFGQTRNVTVHRVILRDSVDERILRSQDRKLRLSAATVG